MIKVLIKNQVQNSMKNINKRLIQQSKILLKGQQADSHFIWKCMDDQQQTQSTNVYYYCLKIFQSLINVQKKTDTLEHHEAMLSTLLVLQFYKNMKEKVESFMNNAKDLFAQNHMKLHQHAEWVVGLFLKSAEQSSFAKQFISRLCHAPKKLSWVVQPGKQFQDSIQSAQIYSRQLQIQRIKQQRIHRVLKHTSFPKYFQQSRIFSFGYICFIDYLRSTNLQVPKEIYEHMLDLMKGFVHSFRSTEKTNELFLSFLFLLKQLITFYGCLFDDIMKEMIYLINIVRNFYGIIGQYASQVFEIVHGQLKCKGTAFRKKIRADFPSIDIKMADVLSKKVVILSNQVPIFNTSQSCTLNNLRKMLIYNIFACCDPENAAKNWKNLELIDSDLTYTMYYKLSRLVDLTMSVQNYKQLHALQKQSIVELIKYNPLLKGKSSKDQLEELGQIVNHDHQMRFFQYPQCQITQVKLQNFENKKYMNSIHQLFENLKIGNNELFYQNKVSFALIGDDYQIGRWLKTIVSFMEELSIFLLQKLQIYLIPTKRFSSSMAEYIATKDLWYRRFIYNVFHEKVLFPDVEVNQNCQDIFPHYLFNKSIQMYIRQAERIFPIQVYKCILKLNQVDQEEVMYFTSHILIGNSAEVEILRNSLHDKTKKHIAQDTLDIYLEKIKKPSALTIDMQVSYRQSLSNQSFKRTEKKMIVEDLQICNTPRQYFMGNTPNPSDRFLQMSILTQKMGRVWRKQLSNKDTFKRNNQYQIQQAFKDLFINLSADFILIENLNPLEPLKVVIDGAATNKVDRLMIFPVQNKDKYPMRLPIKTFLPFEV